MNIAIPLCGKMAFRSFHTQDFIRALESKGLSPHYFIEQKYFDALTDRSRYALLEAQGATDPYQRFLPRMLSELRRFIVHTDTTEVRFRDKLLDTVFSPRPVASVLTGALMMDILRHMRPLAPMFLSLEEALARQDTHQEDFKAHQIRGILTPGVGSYGFLREGLVARQAKRAGIKTVAAISNYDNIVSRGYQGFDPDGLAVWSQQMADDAVALLGIPARKIEIVGAVQFDRYARRPAVSREDYLRSRGLDPAKKTIFIAGSTVPTQYFDFIRMVRALFLSKGGGSEYNIVIRPIPHNKILNWYGMSVFKEVMSQVPGVYISDPHQFSADSFMPVDGTVKDDELDELHCLFSYSDVLINVYSTVSLEAAILDLPTIHLNYQDFSYNQRYHSQAWIQRQMAHNKRPLRLAAARHAVDDQELLRFVEMYLQDRTIDQAARAQYARSECGLVDGQAGQRLAGYVKKVIG